MTKLRNIEDDIFVEDIELVNIETSSEHRRDSKKYETPLEDVDENDPVVDINETPYSMEELSIGGMIQGMSRSYELAKNRNNITDQENNCCLQAGTWILHIVNKYLKNSLISLFFLTCELSWHWPSLYGFITNSGCENPTVKVWTEISYIISFSYFMVPFLIKIKLDRLSKDI